MGGGFPGLELCPSPALVEMTIGILKARFKCLRGLRVTPNRACDITVVCVVLHNTATIRGERHPPGPDEDDLEQHPLNLADHRDGRITLFNVFYFFIS